MWTTNFWYICNTPVTSNTFNLIFIHNISHSLTNLVSVLPKSISCGHLPDLHTVPIIRNEWYCALGKYTTTYPNWCSDSQSVQKSNFLNSGEWIFPASAITITKCRLWQGSFLIISQHGGKVCTFLYFKTSQFFLKIYFYLNVLHTLS